MARTTDEKIIGTVLRDIRVKKGLSQDDLASRAELARSGLGAIEQGRQQNVTLSSFRRIAEALEMSIDDLREKMSVGDSGGTVAQRISDAMVATAGGRFDRVKELLKTVLTPEQLEATIERSVASHSEAAAAAVRRKRKKKGLD